MRIKVKPSRRRDDRITLNLASMIDVTFLLLIYFLVTTVMARSEDNLTPNLQTKSETAAAQTDFQPQVVDVRRVSGELIYQVGARQFTDRRALREALAGLPTSEGIFINVADRVPVEFAMAALQVARDVGFEQVTYVPVE